MEIQTIAEIYEKNERIRQKLLETLSGFTEEEAARRPAGEKWNLTQFAEHLVNAEEGMSKIAYKLLSRARDEDKTSDGTANITANYLERGREMREQKFEAPEPVRPAGGRSLADSIAKLSENRRKLEELRPLFETTEAAEHTFPHPFLGRLNAHEWLALIGDHEERHLMQIKKFIKKLG